MITTYQCLPKYKITLNYKGKKGMFIFGKNYLTNYLAYNSSYLKL